MAQNAARLITMDPVAPTKRSTLATQTRIAHLSVKLAAGALAADQETPIFGSPTDTAKTVVTDPLSLYSAGNAQGYGVATRVKAVIRCADPSDLDLLMNSRLHIEGPGIMAYEVILGDALVAAAGVAAYATPTLAAVGFCALGNGGGSVLGVQYPLGQSRDKVFYTNHEAITIAGDVWIDFILEGAFEFGGPGDALIDV